MRRLFWVAVGATAGVYAVHKVKRKVTRTLHTYSPAGLGERADGWKESASGFVEEVRVRMAEREADLRLALGVTDDDTLTPAEAAALTDHPAAPRPRRPTRAPG